MAEAFDGKVQIDTSGAKFVGVKTANGHMRIAESADHKTVSVSVVRPNAAGTVTDVVYSNGIGGAGLEVNDKPAIDMQALGPKLAQAVSQALASGVTVSKEQANVIGSLTADISQMAGNQRGASTLR